MIFNNNIVLTFSIQTVDYFLIHINKDNFVLTPGEQLANKGSPNISRTKLNDTLLHEI